MTSLTITSDLIPDLSGKTAVVTGGSSGIGLGAVQVLLEHHARVFILDISPPPTTIQFSDLTYIHTDISSWPSLVKAMAAITTVHGRGIDIAIANAGVFETESYGKACVAPLGTDSAAWKEIEGVEPVYSCVEVNLKGTLNFIMLAARVMNGQGSGGSIVLTTSTTAYLPEQSIPVYSATKAALANLVRALAPTFPLHNLSISGVAPSAAASAMVTPALTDVLEGLGIPVSTAKHVGLALVYSATAMQKKRVEDYGKDKPVEEGYEARWNGRIIHTIGDEFWEVEEGLVETRGRWWGELNEERAGRQRVITDQRDV